MTEEIKEEKKCNCDKKDLKLFLLTIFGSFLGCLVALCLFSAAVKPQPPMPKMPCQCVKMHRPYVPQFFENRGEYPNFHRMGHHQKEFQPPFPNQPTPPVRPEIK